MKPSKTIFLDYGATSVKKPAEVLRAVQKALGPDVANPGRGGYRKSQKADNLVYRTRKEAAFFFGAPDPSRVIFTPGCTWSLNIAIQGYLNTGDHVVLTGRQHNSVTRTVMNKSAGLTAKTVTWNGKGSFPFVRLENAITKKTKAVIVNHASNVDGLLFPLKKIGAVCKQKGVALIVDASQTAGVFDINMAKMNIAILCASGHKGLMGPAGIGLLAMAPGIELKPFIYGGTGSFSEDMEMPDLYPDRLEAGSPNFPGIAGLGAALAWLTKTGLANIRKRKTELADSLANGLSAIPGIRVIRPARKSNRAPLFSFVVEGVDPSTVGDILNDRYNIACRVGMHCAPYAHKEIGTYPEGTIRIAPGWFTTNAEVKLLIKTVTRIAKELSRK